MGDLVLKQDVDRPERRCTNFFRCSICDTFAGQFCPPSEEPNKH